MSTDIAWAIWTIGAIILFVLCLVATDLMPNNRKTAYAIWILSALWVAPKAIQAWLTVLAS